MAHPFKTFEIQVLEILLANEYSPQKLSELLEGSSLLQVEYNNYGFYVSVENPRFGKERRVYSNLMIGRLHKMDAGFVVFVEDGHLTLEIHPWGDSGLPATFREGDVQRIRKAAINET